MYPDVLRSASDISADFTQGIRVCLHRRHMPPNIINIEDTLTLYEGVAPSTIGPVEETTSKGDCYHLLDRPTTHDINVSDSREPLPASPE